MYFASGSKSGVVFHPDKPWIKQAEVSVYFTSGTQSKVSFIQMKTWNIQADLFVYFTSGTQSKVSFIQRKPWIYRQNCWCILLPEYKVKYPSSRGNLEYTGRIVGVLFFLNTKWSILHPYFTSGTQSKISPIQSGTLKCTGRIVGVLYFRNTK